MSLHALGRRDTFVNSSLFRRNSQLASAAFAYRRRLRFEPLEDRRLLATFMVGNLNDAGAGSLRQAILDANDLDGSDLIAFGPVAGTIALTSGEMELSEALTITGPGRDVLTIDAQQNSRILNVSAVTGEFSISGLTFTGGRTTGENVNFYDNTFNGGAIRSVTTGNLTITNSAVTGNSTTGYVAAGGGVYAYGNVTLTNSTISGNHTLGESASGGGIYAADLTLNQSAVSGNYTSGKYASGGGISGYGNVTLTDSTVSGNHTKGDNATGGGIRTGGNLTLQQSRISENRTHGESSGGGGFYSYGGASLLDAVVSGNFTEAAGAAGGGLYSVGDVLLANSTVTGNHTVGEVAQGGGIFSRANITLTLSTVSGNHTEGYAARGGGVRSNSSVTLTNSSLINNYTEGEAATGAGIRAEDDVTLTNSTVSGNDTGGDNAFGGGVFTYGNVTLNTSTITGNHTAGIFANGAGVFVGEYGKLSLSSSIVAGNTAVNGRPDLWLIGSVPPVLRYSLVGNNFGALLLTPAPLGSPDVNGNLIGTSANPINPMLGPLADHGGPTLTHVPLVGSPTLDMGDPAALPANGIYDQRAAPFARVVNGDAVPGARVDMGAAERQAIPPAVFGDYNLNNVVDAADYTVWRNTLSQMGVMPFTGADGNGDGKITPLDYEVWKSHYGQTVPAAGASLNQQIATQETGPTFPADEGPIVSTDSDSVAIEEVASGGSLNSVLISSLTPRTRLQSGARNDVGQPHRSIAREAALMSWPELRGSHQSPAQREEIAVASADTELSDAVVCIVFDKAFAGLGAAF